MIDPKLQAELRAKFNPDGSDLRKMQLRMLEMLKYIDKICRKNDIKYWLSSGTCLGAVRHGGFIPWDDDCDIEMLREDYKRLIKILKKENNQQFYLQNRDTDYNYFLPFARLRDSKSEIYQPNAPIYKFNGCWIDIFPLENNSLWAMRFSAKLHNCLLNPNYKYHIKTVFVNKLFSRIYLNIYTPFIRFLNRFTDKRYIYHTYGCCFYKRRELNDIFKVKNIKFEDFEFPVPYNYDHYLTLLYGDFEKIPSLESISTHNLENIKIFD